MPEIVPAGGPRTLPAQPKSIVGSGLEVVARFQRQDDTARVIEALRADGVAIVERCVDDELVDKVAAELRPHFDTIGGRDQNDFNGFRTLRVYAIPARSRTAAELIAHDKVLEIADQILLAHCINYRIGSCSAIEILPGEVRQRLHLDDAIYPIKMPGVQLQVSALWALTDFTEENGATHVLPGSHRDDFRISIPKAEETVQATMPKGSLLLYLGSTWHGGGANRSDSPRMGLVNTYALGWLRQEENHYLSVPREVAMSYPKRMRDLMGYRSHGSILGTFEGMEKE